MFCQNCGSELVDGAVFCTNCGTKAPYAEATQPLQNALNDAAPAKVDYGNNIKPYYREEFDRIASGQKPAFNWAAFLFGGYFQLYHGCVGLFCKTFLPLIIVSTVIGLISAFIQDFSLMSTLPLLNGAASLVSLPLSILGNGFQFMVSLVSLVLSILNGFQFNKWFYMTENPGKKRGTAGLWILIVCQIAVVTAMLLIPHVFSPSYDDEAYDECNESDRFADDRNMGDAQATEPPEPSAAAPVSDTEYKAAYAEKVRELAFEDSSTQFALIDLLGNDIPQLVAEQYDMVSVFTWADGELVTLIDQWGYGVGGNAGYYYLPGENVIYGSDSDYAGAIMYEYYMRVNGRYDVESVYDQELSIRYITDTNGDGWINEGDAYSDDPAYYYGDIQISEEAYESYQIDGWYEQITGDLYADEVLAQLEGSGTPSDFGTLNNFTTTELYLYGGTYEGSYGTSMDVSIYSSFDEESIVGNICLYDSYGYETFATMRDDNEGPGIYTLCLGDGSVMYIGFYQEPVGVYYAEILGLDAIYTNTEEIETYAMTEQYIP